ncbi:hypothetical protein ZWY2020_022457 [Hordeum vulgare]|nr:hypothetical protein ZWY2020_022457 [Hordeum vulgare]
MPPDGHTRKQPTASTLTMSTTREIVGSLEGIRPPWTRLEEPTTEVRAATRAPLNAIIAANQKPAPCLTKPCAEDSPSRSQLRDDAPKEEKYVKTPPSSDPPDLRIIMTPAGAVVFDFDEDRSKDFSHSCVEHPPPTNH